MPNPPGDKLCSDPAVAADCACILGENPLWHAAENCLLWTDIATGRLFRYRLGTGTHEQIYCGRPVGGFTLQRDGSLLLFKDRGTITCWRQGQESTLVRQIEAELKFRFNDVIADPQGRVFCGTVADREPGRLYRLDPDGSLTLLLDGIGCSNGLAFSGDRKSLFFTDSTKHCIYRFDYDESDGSIRNQRIFHQAPVSDGMPDGCTLDAEDCLWYAAWGGAALVRLDPNGKPAARVSIPAENVTSLAFGGPDLSDIYVTSGGGHSRSQTTPLNGALFCLRSSIAGRREFHSNIDVSSIS